MTIVKAPSGRVRPPERKLGVGAEERRVRPAPQGRGFGAAQSRRAPRELLKIGEVARLAGVGVETIRFYERQGLIAEPARRASGYREYREAAVARIRFIKRAKSLGFSLPEVQELLSLEGGDADSCPDVARRIEAKIAEVKAKVEALGAIRGALEEMRARCGSKRESEGCPFLEALASRKGFDESL